HMKELGDQRSNGAARHDDRTFCAEWASRTDRDCRRNRLQNRDPWLHFCSAEKNRFDGLRNPVSANAFRPETRHDADDQAADDWNKNDQVSQGVLGRRVEFEAKTMEK